MTAKIDIRPAESRTELEAVFRFRYKIYVEEMNRKQLYADHGRRRIEDPLDASAINLVARQGDEVVGIVRINFPRSADVGVYNDFYAMSTVGADHPGHTSINTRLMVAPQFRKSRLALMLAIASYEYGIANGIKWNFIDCNEHLVPFFHGLGYIEHVPKAVHDEYGLVSIMRLDVWNLSHLEAVKSPFASRLKNIMPANKTPVEIL